MLALAETEPGNGVCFEAHKGPCDTEPFLGAGTRLALGLSVRPSGKAGEVQPPLPHVLGSEVGS